MSLDKGIEHGKECRKEYRKSKRFDRTCRPNGSCEHCRGNRQHNNSKRSRSADEKFDDYKKNS